MVEPIVPDQSKLLAQLRMTVNLLETNTVTSLDTLKKIASGMRMIPVAEIPNATRHTFDGMPNELKCMVLKHLKTTELLIDAQVSKEWTALVKKIVKGRQVKREEQIEFRLIGRNIWGKDAMPVEQVETLLRSLATLKFKVSLRFSGSDVEVLVEKVGLKLFIGAVLGVNDAHVEMHSSDHLRELLATMGDGTMQLKRLTLDTPLILDSLPEALLLNLANLTTVCIGLMPKDQQSLTKLLLALATNPLKKLKNVALRGGSIDQGADSGKITEAITSLGQFWFRPFGHFAHYGDLFTSLANSKSKLLDLQMFTRRNSVFDQVESETMVAALKSLDTFYLQFLHMGHDPKAHIEALQGISGVRVRAEGKYVYVQKG